VNVGGARVARANHGFETAAPAMRPGAGKAKRVSVLGATGSVGRNTLDLISRNSGIFEVIALTANTNAQRLADLALRHHAKLAVVADENSFKELRDKLAGSGIEVAAGAMALIDAARRPADCVMAAISGAAGLRPTLAAVSQGRRVALANKECLVCAGEIFMEAVRSAGAELVPVDSEHSAAFQAIAGSEAAGIERIVLTASGGPFRTWSMAQLEHVTPAQALAHPNWSMGRKISVDSATLMNKGLELIEAYHLFPVEPEQLEVVVHPQSIIHALVGYRDGSMLAQLANPDMRTPIAAGLSWPARMAAPTKRIDLVALGALTFERPDEHRFRALGLARQAMQKGGAAPAVLSAANEVAVEAFLTERLKFLHIAQLVAETLEMADGRGFLSDAHDLGTVLAADAAARELALNLLGKQKSAARN
jgi:1-deoxy-D-xylulose-5-phosphate reductoisomerase